MLEGIQTLTFPLPAVIDIDFEYSSFKKLALERFFSMDVKGVKKIILRPGPNTKLGLLENRTTYSRNEVHIYI